MLRSSLRLLVSLSVLLLLVSCESTRYYGQAARGQISLWLAREQIDTLLQDPQLPADTRQKLELILSARRFAETDLALPAGRSYLSYVELSRPYVLWNVFAAPEFSMAPVNWCYPIAGCVAYRGFFALEDARRYALQLEQQGFDVYSGGVDAYSTLGWFADPLTSSVLRRPDHRLLGLLFHELAHQRFYLPGDTTFNESFATFVEQEGLRRWLQANPQPGLAEQILADARMQEEFVMLVREYRAQLSRLYAGNLPQARMRERKEELQTALRTRYETLREQWHNTAYDQWFNGPLNNAQLSTVASYNDLVPGFTALLAGCEGDMERFYESVRALAALPHDARAAALLQGVSE
jgi:predicted aminopeptidase